MSMAPCLLTAGELDSLRSLLHCATEPELQQIERCLTAPLDPPKPPRPQGTNLLANIRAQMRPGGLAELASNGRWRPARHLDLLESKLVGVANGNIKRFAVFMPPQHGKSELVSHYFPAWFVAAHPARRVILASYEADFAATWGRKARDVVEEWGKKLFNVRVRQDSSAADRWDLEGQPGGMVTAGVGGAITGKTADLFVIDDPVKNDEQARSPTYREKLWSWYQSVARTRLTEDGAIILIQTRWHRDDLAGRLLDQQGDKWDVVSLPAIALEDDPLGRAPGEPLWPEGKSLAFLEATREEIGPYWWGALYQQDPGAEGGTEWPADYFPDSIWAASWPNRFIASALALDPSKGRESKFGDYAAFVFAGVDEWGVVWVDAHLGRWPSTQLVEEGVRLYREWQPTAFALEINGFQELLAPEFFRAMERVPLPLYGVTNSEKKEVRIRRVGPYLAQKRMRFRVSAGSKLLVQQLRDFPAGEHDDGPDALEMALRTLDHLLGYRDTAGQPECLRP